MIDALNPQAGIALDIEWQATVAESKVACELEFAKIVARFVVLVRQTETLDGRDSYQDSRNLLDRLAAEPRTAVAMKQRLPAEGIALIGF